MKVACVGAGPAGLYSAILMKLRDPSTEITIYERNTPDVTHGWGVVIGNDLVTNLRTHDPATADAILDKSFRWTRQVLDIKGAHPVNVEGSSQSISRQTLLDILRERAMELGVTIHFEHEISDVEQLPEADVVVAADGAGSVVRRARAVEFGTRIDPGRNKYVWLATPHVFDAFTFGFVPTEAGWIWFHAYGYSKGASTFIVECSPETWRGLGFADMEADQNLRALERIFDEHLEGDRLLAHTQAGERLPWLSFRTLTNARWYAGKVVLVGDAAHTAHFTIGSGTRLGMEDAIALADCLHRHDDVQSAFAEYERVRQLGMLRPQREARLSATWFENVPRYATLDAPRFYSSLRLRHSPLTHRLPPRLHYQLYRAAKHVPLSRSAYQWASMRGAQAERQRLAQARQDAEQGLVADK